MDAVQSNCSFLSCFASGSPATIAANLGALLSPGTLVSGSTINALSNALGTSCYYAMERFNVALIGMNTCGLGSSAARFHGDVCLGFVDHVRGLDSDSIGMVNAAAARVLERSAYLMGALDIAAPTSLEEGLRSVAAWLDRAVAEPSSDSLPRVDPGRLTAYYPEIGLFGVDARTAVTMMYLARLHLGGDLIDMYVIGSRANGKAGFPKTKPVRESSDLNVVLHLREAPGSRDFRILERLKLDLERLLYPIEVHLLTSFYNGGRPFVGSVVIAMCGSDGGSTFSIRYPEELRHAPMSEGECVRIDVGALDAYFGFGREDGSPAELLLPLPKAVQTPPEKPEEMWYF
jgi:predicted nucleotidyltransferase